MANNSLPERQTELVIGYALDSLSEAEKQEFEESLKHNPALVAELRKQEELLGLLARAVPPVSAPSSLRQNILTSARASHNPPPPTPLRSRWRWETVVGAIAACFILGLGLQNYLLLQKLISLETDTHAEQTVFSFTLKTPSTTNLSGEGEVLLDLETGRALFAIQNLPPLNPGEVYTLWAFTQEQPILCGMFFPSPSGSAVAQIPIPLDEYGSPIQSMGVFQSKTTNPADLSQSKELMVSGL